MHTDLNTHILRRLLLAACLAGFFLLLLLVVQGRSGTFDDSIRSFFYSLRSSALTPPAIVLTNLANKYTIIGFCLLLLILPQTRLRYGLPLSAGALATTILNHLIKELVERPRPDITHHLVAESGFSFPSGHSISSMFFYGMAICLVWYWQSRTDDRVGLDRSEKTTGLDRSNAANQNARDRSGQPPKTRTKKTAILLTVLLLIPLIFVGLTRIYLGVHFPTDVLAGWLLGLASILIEIEIIEFIERRRATNSKPQNSTLPGPRSK